MAKVEIQTGAQEVALAWMQVASGVAQGLFAPEEGVAMLQALAEVHPADGEWLREEAETIRYQFGLDVEEQIRAGQEGYWIKLFAVVEALLDERLDHARALGLLTLIDAGHPEHTEQTNALISDIEESPLRRFLEMDD